VLVPATEPAVPKVDFSAHSRKTGFLGLAEEEQPSLEGHDLAEEACLAETHQQTIPFTSRTYPPIFMPPIAAILAAKACRRASSGSSPSFSSSAWLT
jgi:hypothetical protein